MSRLASNRRVHVSSKATPEAQDGVGPPLVWSFDGSFERSLADAEDCLRRAIVMVGDVARIAVLVELSLPALKKRFDAGDTIQPAWGRFLENIARCGLPVPTRVRHLRGAGPLVTLVIAFRS
jgi:hypothetical protein